MSMHSPVMYEYNDHTNCMEQFCLSELVMVNINYHGNHGKFESAKWSKNVFEGPKIQ
jgi:hypothetical protein